MVCISGMHLSKHVLMKKCLWKWASTGFLGVEERAKVSVCLGDINRATGESDLMRGVGGGNYQDKTLK